MEKLIDKIKEFFDSINCEALVVLKTPLAGKEVDNGCGVEFELPEYAVIHKGDLFHGKKYSKLYRFEKENNTTITAFGIDNVKDKDKFIDELKEKDSYEVLQRW